MGYITFLNIWLVLKRSEMLRFGFSLQLKLRHSVSQLVVSRLVPAL